jgi:hypothetical protein
LYPDGRFGLTTSRGFPLIMTGTASASIFQVWSFDADTRSLTLNEIGRQRRHADEKHNTDYQYDPPHWKDACACEQRVPEAVDVVCVVCYRVSNCHLWGCIRIVLHAHAPALDRCPGIDPGGNRSSLGRIPHPPERSVLGAEIALATVCGFQSVTTFTSSVTSQNRTLGWPNIFSSFMTAPPPETAFPSWMM